MAVALIAPSLVAAQSDVEALRACAALQDDAQRLSCYDRAMAKPAEPARAEAAPAPPAANAPAPAAAPKSDEKFGYRGAIARKELEEKARREPGLDKLEASVVEVARRPRGELVVTLDNGQVWAQKTADSARVKVGDRVSIKKASFGSFLMVLPNNRATRVTREQ